MTPNPYIVNCPSCGRAFEPSEPHAVFNTACGFCRAGILVVRTSRGLRLYALEQISPVASRIQRALGIDDWRELDAFPKELDSLDAVEYVMRLEAEFGEQFESSEEWESFPDMVDWLIRRLRLFRNP